MLRNLLYYGTFLDFQEQLKGLLNDGDFDLKFNSYYGGYKMLDTVSIQINHIKLPDSKTYFEHGHLVQYEGEYLIEQKEISIVLGAREYFQSEQIGETHFSPLENLEIYFNDLLLEIQTKIAEYKYAI